jgi:PAS domain S-box-containing protein
LAPALARLTAAPANPAEQSLPRFQAEIYHDRSRVLEALGRHRLALADLQRYVTLTAGAELAARADAAAVLSARFNTEHVIATNSALQAKLRNEQGQLVAQRAATRWAAGFAVLGLLASALLGYVLAISARHRRSARRQDLVLRTLASNAPDTLLLLGADGSVIFSNRPLFDDAQSLPSGSMLIDEVPAQAKSALESALNTVAREQTAVQFDIRLRDSQGASRHFEQHALPITESGQFVGATLRSTEVTQRRGLEEKLVTQSRVLDTMNEGVILVNEQKQIEYANPAFLQMIGGSSADIRTLNLEGLGLDLSHIDRAATSIESTLERKDGSQRLVRVAYSGLALYERHWVIGVVQDVTEARRLELEIINVAIRERDRFSTDVHEGLGQELVGIALLLEGVRSMRPRESKQLMERLSEIIAHVNRTIQLARDLAHGLSPIHIERCSLGAALTRLATDLSSRFHVKVRCQSDSNATEVGATVADYLYRGAREAVSNARRHGGATEIDIELYVAGEQFILSVSDNGTGIREHGLNGGLGLRIIAYRAHLIGGTMEIRRSSLGGTCILISVPMTRLGVPFDDPPHQNDGRP